MTRRGLFVLFVMVGSLLWTSGPAAAAGQSAFAYGDARFFGSTGVVPLNQPVVGMAATATGDGYWLVSRDGRVFAFGAAAPLGSVVAGHDVVGIAATPTGRGYWVASAEGGIFSFGDARFFGSLAGTHLSKPIVGIAGRDGGYWLVAADGGVFSFGSAGWFGSTGDRALNQPIAGMAATPSGGGYWLVARDGGIFNFGDARFVGSAGALRLARPIAGMAPTPSGRGYWLVGADGGLFTYGDARYAGGLGGTGLTEPAVAVVATPTGMGYWLATTGHLAASATANAPQVVIGAGSHAVSALGPVLPGTYRRQHATGTCTWQRLAKDGAVLASGSADVVTIRPTDARFATNGCAPFVNELFPRRIDPSAAFGDGTWVVPADVGAWHWSAPGGPGCTWRSLRDFSEAADATLATGGGTSGQVVDLGAAAGFLTTGCGTWTRR